MRCKTCHYSLANLTEHRCPECGRAFDPQYPFSYLSDADMRAIGSNRRYLVCLLVINVVVFIAFALFTGNLMLVLFALPLPIGLSVSWVLGQLQKNQPPN